VIAANAHRDEVTDSDFELLVVALLLEHGLPEPVVHHELRVLRFTWRTLVERPQDIVDQVRAALRRARDAPT
jgi:hypothetical protein